MTHKPAINLAKYKAAAGKQTILLDYSRAEVNEMQILKQADVVMLNYMLPEQFSSASCLANLQFYEPRTIHDSSLSKAIHRHCCCTLWPADPKLSVLARGD